MGREIAFIMRRLLRVILLASDRVSPFRRDNLTAGSPITEDCVEMCCVGSFSRVRAGASNPCLVVVKLLMFIRDVVLCGVVEQGNEDESTPLVPGGKLKQEMAQRSTVPLTRVLITFLKSMVGSYILYTPKVSIARLSGPNRNAFEDGPKPIGYRSCVHISINSIRISGKPRYAAHVCNISCSVNFVKTYLVISLNAHHPVP